MPENPSTNAVISVIICTYNRMRLLPRAIESLQHQTIAEWEGIIIDDGSTDSTRSVVENVVDTDSRFRYFYQENGGLTSARNAGIARASAPLLTFLDSDDRYEPEHLELRLKMFQQHPDLDLLFGGLRVVGGPDTVPDLYDPTRNIHLDDCFVGGTFVMRRDWARQMGGFERPDYGNDYQFARRAIDSGAVVRKIDAPTYIYHRDAPDSMCNLMEKSCQRENHGKS